MGDRLRVAPADLADSIQVRLQRMYPGARHNAAAGSVLVPLPPESSDAGLIAWTTELLVAIFGAAGAKQAVE